MRTVLTCVLLALLLLGAGGIVVPEDHRGLAETQAGAVLSEFSLLALIEAHEPGAEQSMEYHPVCTDCTGLAAMVGVIGPIALASLRVTAHAPVPREVFVVSPLDLSPPAPPPR